MKKRLQKWLGGDYSNKIGFGGKNLTIGQIKKLIEIHLVDIHDILRERFDYKVYKGRFIFKSDGAFGYKIEDADTGEILFYVEEVSVFGKLKVIINTLTGKDIIKLWEMKYGKQDHSLSSV